MYNLETKGGVINLASLVTESLGGFGSGHHQGQGTPPGPKGTYRDKYRSSTNTALTSAEGIEHTTSCKEVVRSLPTEPTCVGTNEVFKAHCIESKNSPLYNII